MESQPSDLENSDKPDNAMLSFMLPSVVAIDTIEELALQMKQSGLLKNDIAAFDASQIEIITTPGLQLLISAAKTLEQRGGIFFIIKPASALKQAFLDSGLSAWLSQREAFYG